MNKPPTGTPNILLTFKAENGMNITQKTILLIGAFLLSTFTVYAIQLQSNIQDSENAYGQTQGIVIDFDSITVPASSCSEPLIEGKTYSVDSLSLRVSPEHEAFLSSTKIYIGVYKDLAEQTELLSGFLGVSDTPIHIIKNSITSTYTWNFSGITVTPEANPTEGNDRLFFIFQKEKAPLTKLKDFDIPIMRSEIHFQDSLATIVRENFEITIVKNRTPDYKVTLSHSSTNVKKITIPSSSPKKTATKLSGIISFMLILLLLFRRK